MIAATFEKFPGTKSSTSTNPKDVKVDRNAIFVCLFLLFSWYWTTQVTKNVVHVTVSGVFSSFYFLQGSSTGMPRWPTLGSLKRALTSSFGSICFGSLLIAIIQFIRMLLRMAMDSSGQSDACTFFLCCIECLLQFIQQLAELFNVYAFTQVAMYGKPYCRAAKDTMHLLKDRGIDLIINNNLTGMVLGFGGLMVGGLTGLLAFIVYLIYPPHSFASSEITSFTLVVVGAIVFGSIVFFLLAEVIESGTATTFVALAEDPATLKATKPELWEEIRRTYPQAAFVSMYG
ncbi:putative choline transporter, neither null mutation nor overexpression affects choline transport [Coelomomyces lativittatus]|nr:putative choline transporter, neither null mutation nor overexpression affects choline transport [Coelomomyces lativittatus]